MCIQCTKTVPMSPFNCSHSPCTLYVQYCAYNFVICTAVYLQDPSIRILWHLLQSLSLISLVLIFLLNTLLLHFTSSHIWTRDGINIFCNALSRKKYAFTIATVWRKWDFWHLCRKPIFSAFHKTSFVSSLLSTDASITK